MNSQTTNQTERRSTTSPAEQQEGQNLNSLSKPKPRRRYIKVDVSEDVFIHVHDMANKSRMRLLPYLRRFLEDCCPFDVPNPHSDSVSFESDRNSSIT